jgi:hypothetical protein
MIEAAILGLTRYLIGSTPIVYRASTCSELRRIPISAAMLEPARAAIMIAVRTGPNSLTRVRDGRPESTYGAEFHQRIEKLQSKHHTRKKTHQQHNQRRTRPDIKYLVHNLPELFSSENIDKGQRKENRYCTEIAEYTEGPTATQHKQVHPQNILQEYKHSRL